MGGAWPERPGWRRDWVVEGWVVEGWVVEQLRLRAAGLYRNATTRLRPRSLAE